MFWRLVCDMKTWHISLLNFRRWHFSLSYTLVLLLLCFFSTWRQSTRCCTIWPRKWHFNWLFLLSVVLLLSSSCVVSLKTWPVRLFRGDLNELIITIITHIVQQSSSSSNVLLCRRLRTRNVESEDITRATNMSEICCNSLLVEEIDFFFTTHSKCYEISSLTTFSLSTLGQLNLCLIFTRREKIFTPNWEFNCRQWPNQLPPHRARDSSERKTHEKNNWEKKRSLLGPMKNSRRLN